jgi:hypothetical protein
LSAITRCAPSDVCHWPDCVEKVENVAMAKFAQKRADCRLRLAMPAWSFWEGHWMDSLKRGGPPTVAAAAAVASLVI